MGIPSVSHFGPVSINPCWVYRHPSILQACQMQWNGGCHQSFGCSHPADVLFCPSSPALRRPCAYSGWEPGWISRRTGRSSNRASQSPSARPPSAICATLWTCPGSHPWSPFAFFWRVRIAHRSWGLKWGRHTVAASFDTYLGGLQIWVLSPLLHLHLNAHRALCDFRKVHIGHRRVACRSRKLALEVAHAICITRILLVR